MGASPAVSVSSYVRGSSGPRQCTTVPAMKSSTRFPSSPWRSPLRGPWLTSVFGVVLLVGIPLLFITGLLVVCGIQSEPVTGQRQDSRQGAAGSLPLLLAHSSVLALPTEPGAARDAGDRPGARAAGQALVGRAEAVHVCRRYDPSAHALERLSLLLLVGGGLFEFVTGILNVQLDYLFPGSFYPLHFYGAWVFIGALRGACRHPYAPGDHRALRSRDFRAELRTNTARHQARAAGRTAVWSPPTRPSRPSPGAERSRRSDWARWRCSW